MVLVDFECSEILKQVLVLQETSPNRKRKHIHFDPDVSCRSLSDEVFINPSKFPSFKERSWKKQFSKSNEIM